MSYRWEVNSTIEIHRSIPVKRYMIATAGGFFPVLTRLKNNSLFAVFRTGDFHIGERGRLEGAISTDGGETWSEARTIVQGGSDARNPSLIESSDGSLLVSFIRAAYSNGHIVRDQGYETVYITRSHDKGLTWSEPSLVDTSGIGATSYSPFGKMVELPDNTILMALHGNPLSGDKETSWILRSRDGGVNWGDPSLIQSGGTETALLRLRSGKLLAAVRNDFQDGRGALLTLTSSVDNGYSWSDPRPLTGPTQIPGDLVLLNSGKVLLTFGHRTSPFGVRAIISSDDGETWDHKNTITLVADCVRADCGYPSSVQLVDESIFTAYYTYESSGPFNHGTPQYGMFMGPHAAGVKYRECDLP